jgi:5-methyltetrahydropteroyltriglutamate--homocysteine methyltransferase
VATPPPPSALAGYPSITLVAAGACGFLILIQSGELPDLKGRSTRLATMRSSPMIPGIAANLDQIDPEPSVEAYRKFTMRRVDALNRAIKGLPQDRIRFHLCWGSWHGPHTTDLPMLDIVDVMLAINCQAYSFEAGNVRHEHEWVVWQDVKLPDDKIILPGVVSHATNVVEHPELVAQRIRRFANLVGRERVIASTDCGLGGRIHPDIAFAKLEALAQGAALATKQLRGK